jgi:ATP-dependent Clp protease ATP-binding subunit ClpC
MVMFERYTESARRVLYFARYEASELSHTSIEPVHLLLGVLRASEGVTGKLLAPSNVSYEAVRGAVDAGPGEKPPTSVEIPFSRGSKHVLDYTAQEADRLGHSYIGTEHLLLGLLRQEQSAAFTILNEYGIRLDAVRDQLKQLLTAPLAAETQGESGFTAVTFHRLDRIERLRHLVDRLEHAAPGSAEAREAIDLIRQALDTMN